MVTVAPASRVPVMTKPAAPSAVVIVALLSPEKVVAAAATGAVVSTTTVLADEEVSTVPAFVVSNERMLWLPLANAAAFVKLQLVVVTVALPSFSPVFIKPSLFKSSKISTVLDAVLMPVKTKPAAVLVMPSVLLLPVSDANASVGALLKRSLAAKSVTLLSVTLMSLPSRNASPFTSIHKELVDLSKTTEPPWPTASSVCASKPVFAEPTNRTARPAICRSIKSVPRVKSVTVSVLKLVESDAAVNLNTSTPSPPVSVSIPAPPTRVSEPPPPVITSVPVPPCSRSLPAPPVMVSLPTPPSATLLPPPVSMVSLPPLPLKLSSPAPP